ncbi:DEAD/DEAH box helicase [Candidatus Dojkabacteria bacterium]|uniref:DEAD/DEAH box helicase n=1 Tax=Candidatus Dojkabacteria bacterium TaxID=2099670 RepID=A0A5C7J9C6_9BACT|nr:MAG: DEAD/DEAH box helicase [Candidatus Dojkabacteria bacterium]
MQNNSRYFTLNGDPQEKLGYHGGIYTRSYQEVRAIYDAKIRSWAIEYRDNLFYVTDSKEKTETVYFDHSIKNCSCDGFVENQSGTCMHIEAIHLLNLRKDEVSPVRPIVFLNDRFQLKQIGKERPFFTPSVRPFLQMVKKQTLPFDERVLPDDLEPLKEFGIDLFSFQKESVRAMIKNKRSMLILKMGLGKTICALSCCKILDKKKIIIVSPNSLKFQWQGEINRFKLGSSLLVLKGDDLANYQNQKFLIISYEMLNRHPEVLDHTFDIAIADEIQKIKNAESVSWATLTKLKSDFVFALSGTPIQNNLSDLLALITFLNPYEIKPEWKFYEEYCRFSRAKMYGVLPHKVRELREKLDRYIINPKVDYSSFKLPSKQHHLIKVGLTEDQARLHGGYLEGARPLIAKSINYPLTLAERTKLNSLLTLARMAVTDARLIKPDLPESDRMKKIQEQIKLLTDQGQKVVIYSEWIKSLQLLEPFLVAQGIKYACFNGNLSTKVRDKELKKFIEDRNVRVFLSTDSGGLGIDGLQFACHNIIHVEKLWNPMKIDQRNGRLVRALQKSSQVDIFEFTSGSEVELMIDDASERKHAIIADMLA